MKSDELVIIEDAGFREVAYPKYDLTRNKVKVFKGVEFDIDDFICLSMLENHDPEMVSACTLDGQTFVIYYDDGTVRRVGLEERKVLWEKYTEYMIEVRRRLLPNEGKKPLQIKDDVIVIK